ncbi:unnamed protein product [Paramecium pentaurelia]|uniref:FAD-dependent oxidoreductase domain-containing protein 1 n=1 Tax=Paramecium pentaurelia TaxID=43138 RepID=A0A8S1TXU1_9CILI|nr:unnamed protein product [Paramecium pentaurelia]
MIRNILKFGFSTSTLNVEPKRKFSLFKLIVGAAIGVYGFDQGRKYREYLSNTFLTKEQINDLALKNMIKSKDQQLIAHPINSVNNLKNKEKVVVIGGGIIGISQALKLLRMGYNVTVIEQANTVASECSAFNGNVFNPMYFLPLVTKDNLIYMIKNIFEKPELTTVRFNMNAFLETNFIQWGINSLLLSMTDNAQILNSKKQLRIGSLTLQDIEKLKPSGLFKGHLIAKGQLGFFASDQKVNAYRDRLELLGIPHIKVDSFEQIEQFTKSDLKTEPNLKLFNRFKKALILTTESNLETRELTQAMLKYCQENFPNQFAIAFQTSAQNFVLDTDKYVKGIQTNKGIVLGDSFVICLAHKSKELAHKLRLNLPIVPAKGWAMGRTAPQNFNQTLVKEFTLNTPNYFATNLNGHLRLAGCAEVCTDTPSTDASSEWGAIQILNRFNEQNGFDFKMSDFTVRSCFRPLTPDDVAIISDVPGFKNVFINAGHGSRGMSYCFGAADIMSQVMEGSKEFEDYNVKRYYFI